MRSFSSNTYEFKSDLTFQEFSELYKHNILEKDILIMIKTNKAFIGNMYSDEFSLISSSMFPYGAFCVVKGQLIGEDSLKVSFRTNVHSAFNILWIVWIIAMSVLMFLTSKEELHFIPILIFCIAAILFRLFIHSMYILSRNNVIRKMISLFELNNL